ncbi:cupredoxin domain-containing protein [Anaerobacillus sp. MEB173]|uniref:cupredoxin domain-containing protein n=1 Tax=Anaerobacillus sp. MEB173 TaxID=3383345 RepID=UPI003F8FCA3C
MTFMVVRKKWLVLGIVCIIIATGLYFFSPSPTETTMSNQAEQNEFEINLVTGEFKTTTEDGKEIEAYRWDPGTIFVPKGEKVKLSIFGVNGKEHPFIIEGTDVSGTVQKGKETVLHLQFEKEGVYRLICTTHATIADNGPMIGYIVVQ